MDYVSYNGKKRERKSLSDKQPTRLQLRGKVKVKRQVNLSSSSSSYSRLEERETGETS